MGLQYCAALHVLYYDYRVAIWVAILCSITHALV
jgi:hypothetical protein